MRTTVALVRVREGQSGVEAQLISVASNGGELARDRLFRSLACPSTRESASSAAWPPPPSRIRDGGRRAGEFALKGMFAGLLAASPGTRSASTCCSSISVSHASTSWPSSRSPHSKASSAHRARKSPRARGVRGASLRARACPLRARSGREPSHDRRPRRSLPGWRRVLRITPPGSPSTGKRFCRRLDRRQPAYYLCSQVVLASVCKTTGPPAWVAAPEHEEAPRHVIGKDAHCCGHFRRAQRALSSGRSFQQHGIMPQ